MAKEFKTFAQLIELLESRGVLIDATTADCLRRESYYAIIKGVQTISWTVPRRIQASCGTPSGSATRGTP